MFSKPRQSPYRQYLFEDPYGETPPITTTHYVYASQELLVIPFCANLLIFFLLGALYTLKNRNLGFEVLINPFLCVVFSCLGGVRLLSVLYSYADATENYATAYNLASSLFTTMHIISISLQCILVCTWTFSAIDHWMVRYLVFNINRSLVCLTVSCFFLDFEKLGTWIERYMQGGVTVAMLYVSLYLTAFLYACMIFDLCSFDLILTLDSTQLAFLVIYYSTYLIHNQITSFDASSCVLLIGVSHAVYLITRRLLWTYNGILEDDEI
ncbi:protein E16 [Proboscivirus elephantidbeta4]|uniref:Protein E16 n=2 Tax=Elephant endotheliotropic herpesvirus 4 TaxID=548914 RepID=A0A0S1TPH7_9BETA|nr:protein E16 [Elephant endotheliotropic herpesvirus 4]ALM25951.1 protein E16 [Elephant endotheliotropic herpesvirus 4]